jgi:hypothetical protein
VPLARGDGPVYGVVGPVPVCCGQHFVSNMVRCQLFAAPACWDARHVHKYTRAVLFAVLVLYEESRSREIHISSAILETNLLRRRLIFSTFF